MSSNQQICFSFVTEHVCACDWCIKQMYVHNLCDVVVICFMQIVSCIELIITLCDCLTYTLYQLPMCNQTHTQTLYKQDLL